MKNNNIFFITITSIAIFSSVNTYAAVCPQNGDMARKIAERREIIKSQVEKQIDTKIDMDNNPFVYVNKDKVCDLGGLGLHMPGLPTFGFGFKGIDGCSLLKSVTGDMVSKINQRMQDSVDKALDKVIGMKTDFTIDLGQVAQDEIEHATE